MKGTYQKIWDKLEHVSLANESLLLEIGVGTGYSAKWLLDTTPLHYTGVDISSQMLAQATTKIKQYAGRHELICTDFLQRETDKQFDVIISNSVLHFMDYEKVLEKIVCLLKPGGKFIIVDWSNDGWFRMKQLWIYRVLGSGLPSLSFDCMEKLCTKVGLQRTFHEKRKEGGFMMQLIDNVDTP